MLLGRPWLYAAEAVVDWGAREFVFGNPKIRIPWKTEAHQDETTESDGYTTDWSDPEGDTSVLSYFVEQFAEVAEQDFQFPNPVLDPTNQPEGTLEKEDP